MILLGLDQLQTLLVGYRRADRGGDRVHRLALLDLADQGVGLGAQGVGELFTHIGLGEQGAYLVKGRDRRRDHLVDLEGVVFARTRVLNVGILSRAQGEHRLGDLVAYAGDRLPQAIETGRRERPDRDCGRAGLLRRVHDAGAGLAGVVELLTGFVSLVLRGLGPQVGLDLGPGRLQGRRRRRRDLAHLDRGESQVALDRPGDLALLHGEGGGRQLGVGDRGAGLVVIDHGFHAQRAGDRGRILALGQALRRLLPLGRRLDRDLYDRPRLGRRQRRLAEVELLLDVSVAHRHGRSQGGGGKPRQGDHPHLRPGQLGRVGFLERQELGVGGREGLHHSLGLEHEIAHVAILQPRDGAERRVGARDLEPRSQGVGEVPLRQLVAEVDLHLAWGQTLAGEKLRKLPFAELARHPVEGHRNLPDLGVDQRRVGNNPGARQHFGLAVVEGDLVEQFLVEAVGSQKFIGVGLLGLLLEALFLLLEDAPEVAHAGGVAAGGDHRISARSTKGVGKASPAAHAQDQEHQDEQSHQGDGDGISGRRAKGASHMRSKSRIERGPGGAHRIAGIVERTHRPQAKAVDIAGGTGQP